MSPTGTNRTNKGFHIKVQEVCKAVYEPHRNKQNKETKGLTHVKYKTMGQSQRGQKPMKTEKQKQTDIIQTWKTIEYRRREGLRLPCSMTVLSIWVEFQCYLPSRIKWDNSIPWMHGGFGTFTILFLKGQNTNTSIDSSFANQNREKPTNQKATFHKQLTNRNTE